MSAIGISSWWPKSCQATNWWGSWSTEVALNLLRVLKRLEHPHAVGLGAERVGVGVAEVDAERVPAVLVDRVGDAVGGEVERLVPGDLHPLVAGSVTDPLDRAPQPVGVLVDVGERHALGADVPARERVVGLPRMEVTFGPVRTVLDGQLEAADRLAQVARGQDLAFARLHAGIFARR